MSRRYYIAEGKAKETIAELYRKEESTKAVQLAIKKELGAKDTYFTNGFGGRRFYGFSFDDESNVDTSLLRKDKHGVWVPRLTSKAGKDLKERMGLVQLMSGDEVAEAIGVKTFFGHRWCTPGVTPIGDGYLITVDSEAGEPKDCRRISDIEAEQLQKPKRAKRKAVKS